MVSLHEQWIYRWPEQALKFCHGSDSIIKLATDILLCSVILRVDFYRTVWWHIGQRSRRPIAFHNWEWKVEERTSRSLERLLIRCLHSHFEPVADFDRAYSTYCDRGSIKDLIAEAASVVPDSPNEAGKFMME